MAPRKLSNLVSLKDITACIICGLMNNTISGIRGRQKIESAARQREDIVFDRIKNFPNDKEFCYHMTDECYRRYVSEAEIRRFVQKKGLANQVEDEDESKGQGQTSLKSKRKSQIPEEKACIICDRVRIGDLRKRCVRIEYGAAEKFLRICNHFKDAVFTRIALYNNPERLLAANVHYHDNCLRSYTAQYSRSIANDTSHNNSNKNNLNGETNSDASLERTKCIQNVLIALNEGLQSGKAYTLSEICNSVKSALPLDASIDNRLIKKRLMSIYGDQIKFFVPKEKNKSTIVYRADVSVEEVLSMYYGVNSITECAKSLRATILKEDFDLQDKFCDSTDLKESWSNMKIPETFVSFFAALFDISHSKFSQSLEFYDMKEGDEEGVEEEEDDNEPDMSMADETEDKPIPRLRILKIKSLYQIMYYIVHAGKKKTPLHMMTAISVHAISKSASLVKMLNRTGLSISYDEVQRCRTALASYTVESSQGKVPIPAHFDLSKFTTIAFDNCDHNEATNSGMDSMHDTAITVFQDYSPNISHKPKISETNVDRNSRTFTTELECQKLLEFHNAKSPIVITSETPINETRIIPQNYAQMRTEDLIWILSRVDVSTDPFALHEKERQLIPGWSAFNSLVIKDTRPKQIVGFLPILPHPVTEYSTVYTAMSNFNEVLSQLRQVSLPVFCDEGVYRIAKHIELLRPNEFTNLVLMLGDFHLTKIAMSCIGKYLRESGIQNVLVETEAYGINTSEQVLNASNYARAVKGFLMLGEALQRLQLEAFFEERGMTSYEDELISIEILVDALTEKNIKEAQSIFNSLLGNMECFVSDYSDFIARRSGESELFKYYSNVINMIQLVKDLIKSDRTGDWNLHLETVTKMLPLFLLFDRTNYARWAPLYVNDMLGLKEKHPEVYGEFMKGRFTVKQSNTSFTSVATDQGLEQTINRSQKSTSGIIGSTRKKDWLAGWCLSHHEIQSITNVYRKITGIQNDNHELMTHHELSSDSVNATEKLVSNMIAYFKSHVNPFASGSGCKRWSLNKTYTPFSTFMSAAAKLTRNIARKDSRRKM